MRSLNNRHGDRCFKYLGFVHFCIEAIFSSNRRAFGCRVFIVCACSCCDVQIVLCPETASVVPTGIDGHYEKDKSLFEAIINGANEGLKMIAGITALLIGVLGLIALVDLLLGGAVSLKVLCGYVFYPFTWLLGLNPQDVGLAAQLIGERVITTEVVAYQDLAAALAKGQVHDPRSTVIITYALCGFTHLASMAIFVGGTAALAPNQTQDLTRVAWRALIAANLACLLTACIAGTLN
jgi:concentrative nucleoside transporter, CNT family